MQWITTSLAHPITHLVEQLCIAILPGDTQTIDPVASELFASRYQLVPGRRYAGDSSFIEEILAIEEDHTTKIGGQTILVIIVGAQFELCRGNGGEICG